MPEWIDIAKEARDAAGVCLRSKHYRSSVSRAYYAVFAAVTATLQKAGVSVPAGRDAYAHARLVSLVRDHLKSRLGPARLGNLKRVIRHNYNTRIDADYVSQASVDKATARRCLTNAITVISQLDELK